MTASTNFLRLIFAYDPTNLAVTCTSSRLIHTPSPVFYLLSTREFNGLNHVKPLAKLHGTEYKHWP